MELEKIVEMIKRLPPDKQVEIFDFVEFLSKKSIPSRKTPRLPLEKEPLFGLWKEREDMSDSTEYVRHLRLREWKRHG